MGQAREGARHQVGVARLRFVVPFGREGAADRAARTFAEAIARGSGIAIENVPGEGGLAGVRRANALAASREPALLLGTPSTHVLLPERVGHAAAPSDAFAPIAYLGSAPNVLLVSARLGVSSVDDLVTRARRERLVYASAGAGQTIHVCTAWFCALAGIAMTHRPYDAGSAGAYVDLEAGRVHVYFDNVLACREAIVAGTAIALAVSDRERSALLPRVPTLAQCGYPRHALDVWFGVFGANLDASDVVASADARYRQRLAALGLAAGPGDANMLRERAAASAPAWREAYLSIARSDRP